MRLVPNKVTERHRQNPLKIQEKSSKSGDIQRPKNTVFGLLLSEGPEVQVLLWVPKEPENLRIFGLFSFKKFKCHFPPFIPLAI